MKKLIYFSLLIIVLLSAGLFVFADDGAKDTQKPNNPKTARTVKKTDKPKTAVKSGKNKKTTTTVKAKKKQKPKFTGTKKKKGRIYYYADGKKLKNGVHKYKGSLYKFSKKGEMLKGWQKVGKKYCYFARRSGKRVAKRKIDGIRIKKDGFAEKSKYNYKKIKTMIKARNIVLKITKSSDSKAKKRLKCFKWVESFPYKRYRILHALYKKKGWECTFANDVFDKHAGCCVSNSAAVAFMFREIGYSKVYVCHDTSHAWASIGKRIYDPVFAEAKSFKKNYHAIPTDYRITPAHKVLIG